MTEPNVVERYSTLAVLMQGGWQPVPAEDKAVRYERYFGLAERIDKPVFVPGGNPAIPSHERFELRATFSRWGEQALWQVEIAFKLHFMSLASLTPMPGQREAPLWLRRGYDATELVELCTAEMTRLEGALMLGWRP